VAPPARRGAGALLAASALTLLLGVLGRMEWAAERDRVLLGGRRAAVFLAGLGALAGGYPPAFWYLAGRLALFAAVLLSVAISWGWFDLPFWLANGMQMGCAPKPWCSPWP
jgi:hypothetical protein